MKFRKLMLFVSCSLILGGEGFSAAPEKKIITGPEDTVYGIAYNNGIPTRSLIAANNLKPPYTLKAGQVLIVPLPNQHIVGQGETVESIAEIYAVNADIMARENNITSPSYITPGTVLTIPARNTETLETALKAPEEITASSLAPLPLVKSEPAPSSLEPLPQQVATAAASNAPLPDDLAQELAAEKGTGSTAASSAAAAAPAPLVGNLAEKKEKKAEVVAKKTEEPKEEKVAAKKEEPKEEPEEEKKVAKKEETAKPAGKEVGFIWPVQGEIVKKFAPGGKNDGINIKVSEGTSVKAAAGGTVMYAGSELKGFGNLLLIKHQDGWVTAYAHNSKLLVKKGDKVIQGQEIAQSGTPEGDAQQPQLHFEIRKVKQPIDPLTKLES